MGGACSTYVGEERFVQGFGGETWGRQLGRPRCRWDDYINLLKPNDIYICRTAALTSKRYILNIYLTNIHTEYFKHAT